jgi:hypothetical protein
MGEVVTILDHLKKKSKARAALGRTLRKPWPPDVEPEDWILSCMWLEGFKIVPVDWNGDNDGCGNG